MKARKGSPSPKDYKDIRARVASAAKLMAGGLSESKAAKKVGMLRSSLQRYIQDGLPKLSRRILQNLPKSTLPKVCQEDLAENRDASLQNLPKSTLPKVKNLPSHFGRVNRDASLQNLPKSQPSQRPSQRDVSGQFLPGNSAASLADKPTRQARVKFEAATPEVAKKLIAIFEALPDDNPEMVLAFAREILDRGLGRPKQFVDVKESREYIEYTYIQELILADPEVIRLAASLAERMEGHAGDVCGKAFGREVEALPPSS